jgi:hypothetical protein
MRQKSKAFLVLTVGILSIALFNVMLSVLMLNAVVLNFVVLNAAILNVVELSEAMLNVVVLNVALLIVCMKSVVWPNYSTHFTSLHLTPTYLTFQGKSSSGLDSDQAAPRLGREHQQRRVDQVQSGANVIKLFTSVSYDFSLYIRAFVPGKPFQPSLMFVGKSRSLP